MTTRIRTRDEVRAFPEGTACVEIEAPRREARHGRIAESSEQLGSQRLRKGERGLSIRYLCRVTGYSRQQMTRLIAQWRRTRNVEHRRRGPPSPGRRATTNRPGP